MTVYFPSLLNAYPAATPYIAQIPDKIRQGDSASWVDVPYTDANGVLYDPSAYTLKYTLAGPIASPLVLTATAGGSVSSGMSWQTDLTTAQSAALAAGLYWWTAQIFGTSSRITIAEGEFTVEADLSLVGANFDNRSVAEKALAAAEAALATFQASGGQLKEYSIGGRRMSFNATADLIATVNYWRARVLLEVSKTKGGIDRLILTRFARAR